MADADIQGMLVRIEATTAQFRRELASADQLVGQTAGSIDRGLGKVDSAFDRTAQKAHEAGNLMRGAFATIAGAGLIGGLIKQADSYGQIADRMRAATSSSAEYQLVQQHLLQTAQETYRPLQEAQELYIRTADVMKSLGYNTQQTMAITDSFSYLLVTNAASADKGATALDAYSKALQTGKIEADGWVSIVTAMPTVTAAVATATGKTAEEIRKLGVEGKLALSDLNKGFEQTVAANREAAAQMSVSVTDALNNISNAISAYIGEANESSGATGELASVLDVVAKNIDVVAAAVAGLLAAGATGYFLKFSAAAWSSAKAMVAEAASTRDAAAAKVENTAAAATMAAAYASQTSAIVENARATEASALAKVRALQASRDQLAYTAALAKGTQEQARYTAALAATDLELAGAKKAAVTASTQLGAALAAESAALVKDTAATEAAATAKRNLAGASTLAGRAGSGLLALLGGPAGIVALAAGAGIAFLTMRDSTDQAALSLDDMKAPLDQIIAKFKTLNEDQRKAALVRWGEAQAEAAKTASTEFGNLAASIRSATVDPGQARLGGYSVQLKEYSELVQRLKDAQANGQALTPILEGLRGKAGIDNAQIDSWIKQAGVVSDAGAVLKDVTLKLNEQSGALNTNTAETNANNAAKAGMSEAGTTYLQALQKQLDGLQDGGNATKIANRYIAEHTELTDTDKSSILAKAAAIEATKEATKQATAATKSGTSAAKEAAAEAEKQTKALADLKTQADIAIRSAAGLAAAYLSGSDKSRQFTLQQKVEEALLKTGAGARKDVEKAINDQQDAQDKLNISKSAYDLKTETADLLAQAKATLQGADALAAYNVQKSMTVALAGKNIEAGSEEYEQLLAATKAQQDAVKVAQQAANAGGIMDRLYPEAALLKDYTEDQKALNAAMALYPENAAAYEAALQQLGNEYEVNRSKATIWGQMTEGAIDRIDEAFASAWGNIGSGAESLWDNLKKGFKQTLGEIAHMLTTKPLLASISNWLTGTDNGQGLSSVWGKLLGSAGGSSSGSGGGLFSGLAGIGKNLYSAWNTMTGVGSSMASGYASGGVSGALSGGVGYYGDMLSNIGSTLSNGFNSLVSTITGTTAAQTAATIGAQGVTSAVLSGAVTEGATAIGAQFTTGVATTTAASYAAAEAGAAATAASLGGQISAAMSQAAAMWPLAVVMGMYQSGKLYSAGVRPDAGEMWDSAGSTALGKAAMLPQTIGAKYFEVTDNILGKVVGGKMAAILSGSTLFQAVWSKVGSKLFGSGYETKDSGISLGVEGGDLQAYQYQDQKKKGGWISGSSKSRTVLTPLDDARQGEVQDAFNTRLDQVFSIFDTLNVDVPAAALDGLNMSAWKISLKDLTTDQVNQLFSDFFEVLGNEAVGAISKSMGLGLDTYNVDQLTEFASNLFSINDTFKLLNVNALPVSVWGGKLAEQYVALAGGMEAFSTATQTYYNAFFTDAEKSANTLAAVKKQFADLNVTFPDTREGFRGVVEGLDSTTDAGREMFLKMMGLASSASTAYDILAQQAADAQQKAAAAAQAIIDALMGAVTGANGALKRAISAQQKATTEAYNDRVASLNDMVSTATENVTGLTSVGNDLGAALKALRGDSDEAVKMLRTQAQATLQSALASARAGGSLSGFTGLSDALDTVSNDNSNLYGSMEDFARDQGRTANVVAELNALNGKQLTAAEQSLKGLQDQIKQAKASYDLQMAQFDQQLEFAQAQMDALNGVDNSVMGVTAAINAMNAAVVAALAGMGGKGATNSAATNGTFIDSIYKDVLGLSGADAAGKNYWLGELANGHLSLDQLAQAIANAAKENGQAVKAGYATGGRVYGPGTGTSDSIFARLSNGEYVMRASAVSMFGTGLLDQMNAGQLPTFATGGGVGEMAPQLQVMAPSRIYSGSQSASMSSGGSSNAQLEHKVDVLIDVVKQIVGPMKLNSDADSKLFKKWDRVGLPTTAVKEPA